MIYVYNLYIISCRSRSDKKEKVKKAAAVDFWGGGVI